MKSFITESQAECHLRIENTNNNNCFTPLHYFSLKKNKLYTVKITVFPTQ